MHQLNLHRTPVWSNLPAPSPQTCSFTFLLIVHQSIDRSIAPRTYTLSHHCFFPIARFQRFEFMLARIE